MKRFIAVALLIALHTSAFAQGKSQGRGKEAKETKEAKDSKQDAKGGPVFGNVEIRIIREWFGSPTNMKGLPPGLAKKDRLPPGLEKQLRRSGSLPPGLEKKIHPFPHDLEVRLPRLPDGRRRAIIGTTAVILDSRLNTILDVLANVF